MVAVFNNQFAKIPECLTISCHEPELLQEVEQWRRQTANKTSTRWGLECSNLAPIWCFWVDVPGAPPPLRPAKLPQRKGGLQSGLCIGSQLVQGTASVEEHWLCPVTFSFQLWALRRPVNAEIPGDGTKKARSRWALVHIWYTYRHTHTMHRTCRHMHAQNM